MTDALARLRAALSDRYRIERELGQGGMATVYLAADLKHDRQVAIKVLKPELAAVLGAERFVQEIKTTAALSHPHILPLFDSGEADNQLYYVMPYIQGVTIREKLDRETQCGIDEAVRITREVADALDYAHRHGVIHRDIKPENILLHDGRPMVMDFGIALAVSAAAGGRMTETGMSLGTPHYMSPEQATADRDITARSDIYSLGSVLYEMLTGEPPHLGTSAQQIIMKIVTEEAQPVTKLRKSVPPNVAAAVAKSLEKLPADRFESAKAFADALGDPGFRTVGVASVGGTRSVGARMREPVVLALAGLSLVLLAAVAVLATRGTKVSPTLVSRFTVAFRGESEVGALQRGRADPGIAIADDGSRYAYLGGAGSLPQILVRSSDQLDPEVLRGTDDVRCCLAFSPDGQSLAYVTLLNQIKVISLQGGIARTVVDSGVQDVSLYGGGIEWGPDDQLYVSMIDGLWRVSPKDGSRERLTTLRPGERTHAWVDVLPNGKGALLTLIPLGVGGVNTYTVGVLNFATGEIEELFQGTYPRYAASGHLVFVQGDGTLLAAPFDQDRLAVSGEPVALLQGIEVGFFGSARIAMSRTGTFLYQQGNRSIDVLTWIDRSGTSLGTLAFELEGNLDTPRVSPDGTRYAVSLGQTTGEHVWTGAVTGGEPVRHTSEGPRNFRINWSRDGKAIFYLSQQDSTISVFVTPADAPGTARSLDLPERRPIFDVVSVDDSTLVIRTDNQATGGGDILLVRMGTDTTVTPLVDSPAGEYVPAISPDRAWMAYVSDEGGTEEVYVRPFPNARAGVVKVSRDGGTMPVWSRSGRELFYRNGAGEMIAAQVETTPTFAVRGQQTLFSAVGFRVNAFSTTYDVSPDGQRFLMVDQRTSAAGSELTLVLNWFDELRRLVPR